MARKTETRAWREVLFAAIQYGRRIDEFSSDDGPRGTPDETIVALAEEALERACRAWAEARRS